MKIIAATLVALILAGATPQITADTLLAEPHPEAFDYYALKTRIGPEALVALRQEVLSTLDGQGLGHAGPGCMSPAQARVLTGLAVAAQASSAEAFAADRAAGEALVETSSDVWRRLQAGEDVAPPYGGVLTYLRRAQEATEPRLAELFSRVARDQFVRTFDPRMRRNSQGSIVDRPAFYASQVRMAEWCAVDRDNTTWIKAQIKDHGWFELSRFGPDADTAAFLIVQHADHDRAFQKEMLPLLEKLVVEKETQARTYAYLYDRIAVAEKRPQRYATQGLCAGPGTWEPHPVEDMASIDRTRADVGLEPLANYVARFNCP